MIFQFRRDPSYLTRYHRNTLLLLIGADLVLALSVNWSTWQIVSLVPLLALLSSTYFPIVALGFAISAITHLAFVGWSWWAPLYALAALPLTLLATSLLHNAAHDNIRPRWLRAAVGELCGLFQFVGLRDWTVVHAIHHAHSDDPERDPHPPMTKGYWHFVLGMRASVGKALAGEYFRLWPRTPENLSHLKRLALYSRGEQVAKVFFWYCLLDPTAFTFLIALSLPLKMAHYAWFNFATHRPEGDGTEIKNLETSIYKLANFFSFGLYFHKNHHLNPKLFDPRRYDASADHRREAA